MKIGKFLASMGWLALAAPVHAQSQTWICETTEAVGFIRGNERWNSTGFKTRSYLLQLNGSSSKFGPLGTELPIACQEAFSDEIRCGSRYGTTLHLNTETGRAGITHLGAAAFGDLNEGDTISIAVGHCTRS